MRDIPWPDEQELENIDFKIKFGFADSYSEQAGTAIVDEQDQSQATSTSAKLRLDLLQARISACRKIGLHAIAERQELFNEAHRLFSQ